MILNYNDYYNKYSNQGYKGESLYKRIMEEGITPNKKVNKESWID